MKSGGEVAGLSCGSGRVRKRKLNSQTLEWQGKRMGGIAEEE